MKLSPISQSALSNGMNRATYPSEIQDNELWTQLNFEFDLLKDITSRPGTISISHDLTTGSPVGNITSMPEFRGLTRWVRVATVDDDIYYSVDEGATWTLVDIGEGGGLWGATPHWLWGSMNDRLIGCHRTTSNDKLVWWTGEDADSMQAITMTDYTGGFPNLMCIWNGRVFIVDYDNPDAFYFSKLGDPENWGGNTALRGGFVEHLGSDTDPITALFPFGDRIFIFKRKRILYLEASVSFDAGVAGGGKYDPDSWHIAELDAGGLGCISTYTVQKIYDRIVYLSDQGVVGIEPTMTENKYAITPLSQKMPEIGLIAKTNDYDFASAVLYDRNEYWLSCKSDPGLSNKDTVYVMNFASSDPRWAKYDGGVVGDSYLWVQDTDEQNFWIGTPGNGITKFAIDRSTFLDDNVVYDQLIETKDYDFGDNLMEKYFNDWAVSLVAYSDLDIEIGYKFDASPDKVASKIYPIRFPVYAPAGIYGVAKFNNSDKFGHEGGKAAVYSQVIHRNFKDEFGRRAKTVQFWFNPKGNGQEVRIRTFGIRAATLGGRRTNG